MPLSRPPCAGVWTLRHALWRLLHGPLGAMQRQLKRAGRSVDERSDIHQARRWMSLRSSTLQTSTLFRNRCLATSAAVLLALSGAGVSAAPLPPAPGPDAGAQPTAAATEAPKPEAPDTPPDPPAEKPIDAPDGAPRWLDAVRAQRHALRDLRRAEHKARRRALDPVGAARQEALEEEFFHRRREIHDQMAEDRRWFLNFGPWMAPLPSPPGALPSASRATSPDPGREPPQAPEAQPGPGRQPPEWNNGWYFHGW